MSLPQWYHCSVSSPPLCGLWGCYPAACMGYILPDSSNPGPKHPSAHTHTFHLLNFENIIRSVVSSPVQRMRIIRPSNVFRDELVNEFVCSDAHGQTCRGSNTSTHAGQRPRVETWTYKQTCHRAQTRGHTHYWHSSGVDSPPLKAKFISLNASSVLSRTPTLFTACHLLLLLLLFISRQLEEKSGPFCLFAFCFSLFCCPDFSQIFFSLQTFLFLSSENILPEHPPPKRQATISYTKCKCMNMMHVLLFKAALSGRCRDH